MYIYLCVQVGWEMLELLNFHNRTGIFICWRSPKEFLCLIGWISLHLQSSGAFIIQVSECMQKIVVLWLPWVSKMPLGICIT